MCTKFKFDFGNVANNKATNDNVCGGPNHCEGRDFDQESSDCQECIEEVYEGYRDE